MWAIRCTIMHFSLIASAQGVPLGSLLNLATVISQGTHNQPAPCLNE